MKRAAPDVDQLMWLLAETGDMKAVEEFEQRFPELRLELAKRVAMVNGLRGERDSVRRPPPRFRPSSPAPSIWRRPFALGLAAACLAALAFGTYVGTRALMENLEPAPEPSFSALQPALVAPEGGSRTSPALEVGPGVAAPPVQPPQVQPEPRLPSHLRPASVEIEEAPLLTVLEAIAMRTGIDLEIAPGMPDFRISASYSDVSGVEMLRDLGTKFGFSILEEGGNRILVVPVRDSSSQDADQGTLDPKMRPGG